MRVLMVMSRLIVGGAETVALELARALKERGQYVSVAAIRGGGGRKEEFARASSKVHDGLACNRFDPTAAIRIARIVRREQIDSIIIVDVLRNGMLFTALGSLLSGRNVRKICWCHSMPGGQAGRFVKRLGWYTSAGLLDAVVCVGDFQRREIISAGLKPDGVSVIPNGLDLSQFTAPDETALPLPENKHIIVQVANVVPDKDFETLIEAVARLAKTRDDFQLVLIGEGTDGLKIAGDVITLAGRREDVPEILQAADMLVLSTKTESFGIAVLEGMASGLPVVVSDLPAFDDLLTHEREGLKVPPGDADALAGAIGRLLDDETLRKQMGDAGAERAKEFTTKQMVDKFQRLLADS